MFPVVVTGSQKFLEIKISNQLDKQETLIVLVPDIIAAVERVSEALFFPFVWLTK